MTKAYLNQYCIKRETSVYDLNGHKTLEYFHLNINLCKKLSFSKIVFSKKIDNNYFINTVINKLSDYFLFILPLYLNV